jgi:hypothetical protein
LRVFKTKDFARFARSERITDERLVPAGDCAERGLVDANLGGRPIKQRVARQGQGVRSFYRTLMAFRAASQTVFLYGFAKSERDNIGPDELDFWRRVATAFLAMDALKFNAMIKAKEIMEVSFND